MLKCGTGCFERLWRRQFGAQFLLQLAVDVNAAIRWREIDLDGLSFHTIRVIDDLVAASDGLHKFYKPFDMMFS